MTHIFVSKLPIIGSNNSLSSRRRQAIMWTNAGILLIGPLRTNFNEILIMPTLLPLVEHQVVIMTTWDAAMMTKLPSKWFSISNKKQTLSDKVNSQWFTVFFSKVHPKMRPIDSVNWQYFTVIFSHVCNRLYVYHLKGCLVKDLIDSLPLSQSCYE